MRYGEAAVRRLLDLPMPGDLDATRTVLELHPQPQLVRVFTGQVPITGFMPLSAAKGLVRVLCSLPRHKQHPHGYAIRQNKEGGRGGGARHANWEAAA